MDNIASCKSPVASRMWHVAGDLRQTIIFTIILLIVSLNLCAFAQDKIVAIVNNEAITQKDLNDFYYFLRMQIKESFQGKDFEAKMQSIKSDLLQKLIEDRLILQEAYKNNLKIEASRIQARISEIKERYRSDAEFQEDLSKNGMVQADIEAKIRDQLLMFLIVDLKVRSRILVDPQEVTDFYRENQEQFKVPEERELQVITAEDQNLAQEISSFLKSGKSADEAGNQYSLSVNKINVIKNGQLRRDIEDMVFKLKPKEAAAPIKIENTYYVFQLNQIIPPHQQNLPEVQDKIYAFLFEKKMQEKLTDWLLELKKHAYVKIL